jgi:hypothetical protein
VLPSRTWGSSWWLLVLVAELDLDAELEVARAT